MIRQYLLVCAITPGSFSLLAEPLCAQIGACCLGSDCLITSEADCESQSGHFNPGIVFCAPAACTAGACCKGIECLDDDPLGGAMNESLCDDLGGTYLGGGACDDDPCRFQRIPAGYEIVDVDGGPFFYSYLNGFNDCGQIAYSIRYSITLQGNESFENFLYDNGRIVRITDNLDRDVAPRINNAGTMVWSHGIGDQGVSQLLLYRGGELALLFDNVGSDFGLTGDINDLGHVAFWAGQVVGCVPSANKADIFFYDGVRIETIFDDGRSNQSVRLNGKDEMVWWAATFPCEGQLGQWIAEIMFYSDAVITTLPRATDFTQPGTPALDDLGRVIWKGRSAPGILELWQNGKTEIFLTANRSMGRQSLNNRGDIAFANRRDGPFPYEFWLFRDGVFYRLSSDQDLENHIDHGNPQLNDFGEMTWSWRPNGGLAPSGIRLMRRIRTGDVDIDDDVDLYDFAYFPDCYTGSVPTDGLCECRFLDIDHDRDVDDDDFDLFMGNYAGQQFDCHGKSLKEVMGELIALRSADCNRNGVVDDCDLSEGSSADVNADGVPDECACPAIIPERIIPTAMSRSRYLSIVPRNPRARTAIRVKMKSLNRIDFPNGGISATPDFTAFEGQYRWVGPPETFPEGSDPNPSFSASRLQCEPFFMDWGTVDKVHVYGPEIVPSSIYEVQVIDESCAGAIDEDSSYSIPTSVLTTIWGDVAEPFTPVSTAMQPDFSDIAAMVAKFKGEQGAPIKARAQLQPHIPDPGIQVSFADISAAVDAFLSKPYPFPGPTACP